MPRPGHIWRHVIISTLGAWLHGDVRGFRSRAHRVHSSGDYRRPPPTDEHAGLLEYQTERASAEVHIPLAERALIGRAIVGALLNEGHRVIAIAVTKVHVHILTELPGSMPEVKRIVGAAKRHSSRAVKATLPGSIWAAGGAYKRVLTRSHARRVHDYILYQQGENAWTWTYKDASLEGVYGRKRQAR